MESCDVFQLLLSRTLDEVLTPEESKLLNNHLDHCPDCKALALDLASLSNQFASLQAQPPTSLRHGILEQLGSQDTDDFNPVVKKNKRKKFPYGRFATTVAAFVLLISAVLFGTQPPSGELPTDTPLLLQQTENDLIQPSQDIATPQENASVPYGISEDQAVSNNGSKTITSPVAPLPTDVSPEEHKAAHDLSSDSMSDGAGTPESLPRSAMFATPYADAITAITPEEATQQLVDFLIGNGETDPAPLFIEESRNSELYRFSYTDQTGVTWEYSLPQAGGHFSCTSTESIQTSATQ